LFNAPAGDPGQADDRPGGRRGHRIEHELADAGGLDDHVGPGLPAGLGDRRRVVRGAEPPDEVWLGTLLHPVQHVHLEAALHGEQGGQQAHGPRSRHQNRAVVAARALGDAIDLLPGLGHRARRLGEHAELAQRRVQAHGELWLERHPLGAVAVALLDPALGVPPVAAQAGLAGVAKPVGAPHSATGAEG